MKRTMVISIFAVLAVSAARAQPFDLSWHTVGGGGVMNSTDGQPNGFTLSGTIGQPDAQVPPVMSAGGFELTGGFWPVVDVCYCPGDTNGDGLKDGADIQRFVDCLKAGSSCICADVDGMGGVNMSDLNAFVADLLAGATCP